MTTPPNAASGPRSEANGTNPESTATRGAEIRPLYWSIRRELWENRSIYVVPLAASALGMLAFFINVLYLPHGMRGMPTQHAPMSMNAMLAMPYAHLEWLLIPAIFIVGVFYSLDALHGERRDRSILFWKSLPVSDLTTVLAKASIPVVVLPLLVFVISVALHVFMLTFSMAVAVVTGAGAGTLWTQLPFFQIEAVLLYGLVAMALWHAPLYAWLLLVSGWARRATFLWAVLPLLAISAFEKLAFRTSYIGYFFTHQRVIGFAANAFNFKMPDGTPIDPHFIPLAQATPWRFLSAPGLWLGLIAAAIFLAAAVRLRRNREPI